MIENEIARKYGQAIFELATEKEEIDKVAQDLEELRDLIKDNGDFKNLLYHPRIAPEVKKRTLKKIVGDEVSQLVLDFCQLLIDKRRIRFFIAIVRDFELRTKEFKEILEVELVSAFKLPVELQEQIVKKLESIFDYQIELTARVDEDLIGGLQIKVGDQVIDGSIKNELEQLQKRLENIPVSKLGVD